MTGLIELRGIKKRFGSFEALRGITLDIQDGEFLTLLGPSGSGKSTLLNVLAGFESPSAGQIRMDGADIGPIPAERRNFGMVFQGYALFPHMSVADNIGFALRIRGTAKERRDEAIARMIALVGLSGHDHKRPDALSGGQQQRVALARALVFEPRLLLLDEPLSALDKNLREQLQSELTEIHRRTGTTFVFVTHDQNEAMAMSDRIAIFNHGEIVQTGPPEALYARPATRFVAEFLGSINMFPLTDLTVEGTTAHGRYNGTLLSAPAPTAPTSGATQYLAVRPEHMRIEAAEAGGASNRLQARLTARVFQGNATITKFALDDGKEVIVRYGAAACPEIAIGQSAVLGWDEARGQIIPEN